jgi:hypothetical protein
LVSIIGAALVAFIIQLVLAKRKPGGWKAWKLESRADGFPAPYIYRGSK